MIYMKYLIAAIVMALSMAAPSLSFGKSKGGSYVGGKGSSHKGGTYASPKGKRYSK